MARDRARAPTTAPLTSECTSPGTWSSSASTGRASSRIGGPWLGGIDRPLRAHLLTAFVRQQLGTFISKQRQEDLEEPEFVFVCYLSPRWALSSTTSRQDVRGQEGDDDDRRRDSDDGDCGGGYDHSAILASLSGVETMRWWDGTPRMSSPGRRVSPLPPLGARRLAGPGRIRRGPNRPGRTRTRRNRVRGRVSTEPVEGAPPGLNVVVDCAARAHRRLSQRPDTKPLRRQVLSTRRRSEAMRGALVWPHRR